MQTDWLPWPMGLKEGRVSFSADQLSFSGVRGTIGGSAIAEAAAQLSISGPFRIDRASGDIAPAVGELYPWLRSQEGLAKTLEPVKSITGTAEVRLNQLSGRPDQPDKLVYDAVVQPRSIVVEVEGLESPVTVAGGAIEVNPSVITLDAVGAALLDAHAKLSGSIARTLSSPSPNGSKVPSPAWRYTRVPPAHRPSRSAAARLSNNRHRNNRHPLLRRVRPRTTNGPCARSRPKRSRRI